MSDHYSYSLYRDPQTAQTFDEKRFGGPIGEMVASDQARAIDGFIGRVDRTRILDVGTGTGRAALALAREGAIVTGIDASDAMLAIARQRAASEGLSVTLQQGDAHAVPFPDRSFEVAISLRVLMHTPDWPRCVAELCRVSDRLVVLDYPSARSAATLQAIGRRIVSTLGGATEPYRVFRPGAIAAALDRSGFRIRAVHRQYVLPIAFHKAIGSPAFTRALESVLARIGLLRLFGSPVTLVAERCASS